ncbi:MAG: 4Fe-4S dicluster domain-containing protein [Thermodesulfobacteriota bacterium]
MKKISIYPEKCTACRLCELGCSFKKTGEFNPNHSMVRVSIFGEEAFYIPILCTQCDEAWCLRACPSGAIYRDYRFKTVKINKEKCVGCRMCTMACPFGTITYSEREGKAIKCDECDGKPECVLFCPTGALVYEEESTPTRRKRMETAKKIESSSKEVQP